MLQFGHSLTAVENRPKFACVSRKITRFNLATALQPWRTVVISPVLRASRTALQFGHSLTAVENKAGPLTKIGIPGLQFGHSLTAVENAAGLALGERLK